MDFQWNSQVIAVAQIKGVVTTGPEISLARASAAASYIPKSRYVSLVPINQNLARGAAVRKFYENKHLKK